MKHFGLIGSLLWFCFFFASILVNSEHFFSLNANEWGDFLAGAFAPLAFFWLVLGYFQQGKELNNSVKALELQAKELKHSVEQQQELVRVNREALSAEREKIEAAKNERRTRIRPRFESTEPPSDRDTPMMGSGVNDTLHYRFVNNGGRASNVRLFFGGKGYTQTGDTDWPYKDTSDFIEGQIHRVQRQSNDFENTPKAKLKLVLTFKDADENHCEDIYIGYPNSHFFGKGINFRKCSSEK